MSPTEEHPHPVQIIVVAYHQPETLRRCLDAVTPAPQNGQIALTRVTVVDNSSDRAVREVAESCGAEYLDPGANLGFGAGVNIALRRVLAGSGTDVLLLNPDALILAQDVQSLSTRLHRGENSHLAALSPALRDPEHRPQRVMWPFPTPRRAWVEALGLGRFNRSPDFAVGTVLLLRWEAICDVGLFDERFFLYSEETDWQRRAHQLGWASDIADHVVAEHIGGASSTDERRRQALFHSGGETYQRKWHGTLGWQLYRAAVLIGCLPRILRPDRANRGIAGRRFVLYVRGPRRVAGFGGQAWDQ
jgi:GT2 family glycosyltransferase